MCDGPDRVAQYDVLGPTFKIFNFDPTFDWSRRKGSIVRAFDHHPS